MFGINMFGGNQKVDSNMMAKLDPLGGSPISSNPGLDSLFDQVDLFTNQLKTGTFPGTGTQAAGANANTAQNWFGIGGSPNGAAGVYDPLATAGKASNPALDSAYAQMDTFMAQLRGGYYPPDGHTNNNGTSYNSNPLASIMSSSNPLMAMMQMFMQDPSSMNQLLSLAQSGGGIYGNGVYNTGNQANTAGQTNTGTGNGSASSIAQMAEQFVGQTNANGQFSQGRNEAWCADFVNNMATKALGYNPLSSSGTYDASCSSIKGTAMEQGKYLAQSTSNGVKPGDAILFSWQGDGAGDDHIGIVESVDPDGTIHTIEGNYGGSDNTTSRVAEATYNSGDSRISGFVQMG